jgi:hypothetical protein
MKKNYLEGLRNPHQAKIYKTFSSEIKEADEAKRILTVKISTPNADRSGDTMNMKGMIYKDFLNNPVVMFAHDYKSKPIAKCIDLKVTDEGVYATVEFPPEGKYNEADIIYWMYVNKYLSAWSIGFQPDDYVVNKEGGYNFKSWDLLEFSAVPVPDNPEALTVMRSKGIAADDAVIEHLQVKDFQKSFVVEKEEKEEKEADNQSTDLPISGLTVGQLKDLLADAIVGKDGDNSVDKKAVGAVKKDVDEVLMLSDVLSCMSWVIWCFENDADGDVNQSLVAKLNQALGLILQVVQQEATMGEKAFKLSDIPKGKDFIKIVAKAGRTISSKHEGMLMDAQDHMKAAADTIQNVLNTATEAEPNNVDEALNGPKSFDDDLLLDIADAMTHKEAEAEDDEDMFAIVTWKGGELL